MVSNNIIISLQAFQFSCYSRLYRSMPYIASFVAFAFSVQSILWPVNQTMWVKGLNPKNIHYFQPNAHSRQKHQNRKTTQGIFTPHMVRSEIVPSFLQIGFTMARLSPLLNLKPALALIVAFIKFTESDKPVQWLLYVHLCLNCYKVKIKP